MAALSRRLGTAAVVVLCTFLLCLVPARALAFETEPVLSEATAARIITSDGTVLYDVNGEQEMPLASITKVMTAMVALDSGIPLDTPIPFVVEDYPEDSQLAGFVAGDEPTLYDLLMATLVFSGNDAANNVAYAVAGNIDDFCALMNAKAQELGMTHTHFANPHGLEQEGHYSCAADLCVMGRYAMEHYPFIRRAVHTRSYDIQAGAATVTLWSTDALMDVYDGLLGIKTGNTESGASFLGAARRNHTTLYSCVLCCETKQGRFDDTAALLDWGFSLYDQRALAHDDWLLRSAPWQDGFWARCPISAQRDVTGPVFCEGKVTYKSTMFKPSTLVGAGLTYGTTVWSQEGRHVGSVTYVSSPMPTRVQAWSPVSLPLFQDVEEMV